MNWEKIKKLNVRIEVPVKVKKLLFLLIGSVMFYLIITDVLDYLPIKAYRIVNFIRPIISAIPAIIIFALDKRKVKDLFPKRFIRQVLIGVAIAVPMIVIMGLVNGGFEMTNKAAIFARYDWYKVYLTLQVLLLIGFMEEFTYRVMIQDYLVDVLGKFKCLAPLLSAILFGLSHYNMGGIRLVVLVFCLGLVWGYFKYYIKDVSYLTVAIAHGTYDYMVLIMPFLIHGN